MPLGHLPRQLRPIGKLVGRICRETRIRMCIRCLKGIHERSLRCHLRSCFGIELCPVCLSPFPCVIPQCPWFGAHKCPWVPWDLRAYFTLPNRVEAMRKAFTDWPWTPERMALHEEATRFIKEKMGNRIPWCRPAAPPPHQFTGRTLSTRRRNQPRQ